MPLVLREGGSHGFPGILHGRGVLQSDKLAGDAGLVCCIEAFQTSWSLHPQPLLGRDGQQGQLTRVVEVDDDVIPAVGCADGNERIYA